MQESCALDEGLVAGTVSDGKSIRLFLADGSSGGLLTAEIMNWTGHVVAAPRSDLAALLRRPETSRTGIYILLGDDPESFGGTLAYIGEGDEVRTRLRQHARTEEQGGKDFWDRAIVLTSKDANLAKAHARYLESRLITLAQQARRSRAAWTGVEHAYKVLREKLVREGAIVPGHDGITMRFARDQVFASPSAAAPREILPDRLHRRPVAVQVALVAADEPERALCERSLGAEVVVSQVRLDHAVEHGDQRRALGVQCLGHLRQADPPDVRERVEWLPQRQPRHGVHLS